MHLVLDGHGPLHVQLTRALKSALSAGLVHSNNRLPPSRLLARELGISRNTVLTAYEQLREDGFIDPKVGSGSYVTVPHMAEPATDVQRPVSPPQSRFSRRGRKVHDPTALGAGSTPKGVRFPFQYGLPLVNLALTSAWARALARAAAYTSPNYPAPQGLPVLREAICDYLFRRRGIKARPDDILIVAGTQQATSLTARVLLDEGSRVVMEDPHYLSMRKILQIHGAEVLGVPVDTQGIRCDLLPQKSPRLICVTPSHQFPTGAVLSLARRIEILQYARQHQCWIFEDDYDAEFRYGGKPVPALRSLDYDDRVIYVGTFSKALFPSLRLAYMVVPAAIRDDFLTAKWADDRGNSAVEQTALAEFMKSGGFERHLRRSTQILRKRRDALIIGLRGCSRGRLTIADSHAGMHLVVWLHNRANCEANAFIELARTKGLSLHSIGPHYFSPPRQQLGLLMGYCGLSTAEIVEAMSIFSACLDEFYSDCALHSASAS